MSFCCRLAEDSDYSYLQGGRRGPGCSCERSASDCPYAGRSCSDVSHGQTRKRHLLLKRFGVSRAMGFQGTQGGLARAVLRALACHLASDPLGSQMRAGPGARPLTLCRLGLCKAI